jgi:hypothetical protein
VGFFKREQPIHEQLAEEAGLDIDGRDDEVASALEEDDAGSMDIEYDEILRVEATGLPGDVVEFVALPDGTLFMEEELAYGEPDAIAEAVTVPAPYHAFAMRDGGDVWSVSVRRVAVVEVPEEIPGDDVELVVDEEGQGLWIDDEEAEGEIPSLESFGAERFDSFSLHARRLDETLWEVTVSPL